MSELDTYKGIVLDLPEQTYHAQSSLSSTGARQILDSPARFHYAQTHPQAHKDAFDLGTAAHTKILGTGSNIIEYPPEHLTPAGNASTKAATVEWVEEQRANGLVVISAQQARHVDGMTEAVLAHPEARALLEQKGNHREVSMFATCPDTDVEMRARFDLDAETSGDVKSARDASPKGFARAVTQHGYEVQQGWYQDVRELVTGSRGKFRFIVCESFAPYLVGIYELDYNFVDMGKVKALAARNIYRQCTDAGRWPGYADDVQTLQPPQFAIYDYLEEFETEEPMKVGN